MTSQDPPSIEDLATLDWVQLSDLALAEDQAGFVGEHLAAQVSDAVLQAEFTTAAALHSARSQALVAMAGAGDPRQAAYQLGDRPADLDSARSRWASVQLALASHYAALPMSSGADLLMTWQLAEAAHWERNSQPCPSGADAAPIC